VVRDSTAIAKEDEQVARAQFVAGQSFYDQANYSDALKSFSEAYRFSNRPALLYNMALCQERLGHLQEAVNLLEKFAALTGPIAPTSRRALPT
jgi:tetratricopeptide (TPR) repeat protein